MWPFFAQEILASKNVWGDINARRGDWKPNFQECGDVGLHTWHWISKLKYYHQVRQEYVVVALFPNICKHSSFCQETRCTIVILRAPRNLALACRNSPEYLAPSDCCHAYVLCPE